MKLKSILASIAMAVLVLAFSTPADKEAKRKRTVSRMPGR